MGLGVSLGNSWSGWFHFGTCHILLKRCWVKIYGDPYLAKINDQHRPALMWLLLCNGVHWSTTVRWLIVGVRGGGVVNAW